MKKIGFVLLVFLGILIYTALRLRNAPPPVLVGMAPFLALCTILMLANPAKPDTWAVRGLTYLGLYSSIQKAHTYSKAWPVWVRVVILLLMMWWAVLCFEWLGWLRLQD